MIKKFMCALAMVGILVSNASAVGYGDYLAFSDELNTNFANAQLKHCVVGYVYPTPSGIVSTFRLKDAYEAGIFSKEAFEAEVFAAHAGMLEWAKTDKFVLTIRILNSHGEFVTGWTFDFREGI